MKNFNYFLMVILLISLGGCAKVPTNKVWRPWVRTLKTKEIKKESSFSIIIEGETLPLLSDDKILKKNLRKQVKYLLLRRGFSIENNNPDYKLTLHYRTTRHDKLKSTSYFRHKSNSYYYSNVYAGSGAASYTGLGTSIALAVGEVAAQALTKNESEAESVKVTKDIRNYIHTISIEIKDKSGQLIWQGDSTWDSTELDLKKEIQSALQLIISNLPSDDIIPHIKKVKQKKAVNYCDINIRGIWFASPALPYKIRFDYYANQDRYTMPKNSKIENTEALEAYVDLIKTTEFALPQGSNDYFDPLNKKIWKKVMLGGEYYLTPGEEKVKILIKLKGESNGYIVDKCWIATEEEYKNFTKNMNIWKEALREYYDVYVYKNSK